MGLALLEIYRCIPRLICRKLQEVSSLRPISWWRGGCRICEATNVVATKASRALPRGSAMAQCASSQACEFEGSASWTMCPNFHVGLFLVPGGMDGWNRMLTFK